MALDKMTIRLDGISLDDMAEPGTWKRWRIKGKIAAFFRYGCRKLTQNDVELHHSLSQVRTGQLLVIFNPGKILYGENDYSNINMDELSICKLLDEKLRGVFKEEDFFQKRIKSIMASTSEIYVDIVRPLQEIKDLYEVLKHMTVPGFNRDDTYANKGTIYFHTGTCRRSSNKQFKVYLKHEELRKRRIGVDVSLGILRIEATLRRRKLKYDFKQIRKGNQSSPYIKKASSKKNVNETMPYLAPGHDDHDLFLLTSLEYQRVTLRRFIEDGCHLDKRITTKENLLQEIEKAFQPKAQIKLVQVLGYLNGECESIKMHKRTIKKYKDLILEMGYHYLYHWKELGPINFMDSFCENIQFGDSDIEIDMMEEDYAYYLTGTDEDYYSRDEEMLVLPDGFQDNND